MVDKRIRHELHVQSLEQYVLAGTAPKGLRLSLTPSMHNFAEGEMKRWNEILDHATQELTKVTIEHCRKTLNALTDEERYLRNNFSLSEWETKELDVFEHKKTEEIEKLKRKKFARDNVSQAIPTAAYRKNTKSSHVQKNLPPHPKEPNVINLSDKELSKEELSILSRGLTFCPGNGRYDEFTLLKDLDNFARNLRLEEYFFDKPEKDNALFRGVIGRQWTPDANRDRHLDLYIDAVQKDVIHAYKVHKPSMNNISKREKEALLTLSNCEDLVIKPADKGGAIVVLNRSDYIEEGKRQLNNKQFYKHLDFDPTTEHKKIIVTTLENLTREGAINSKLKKALITVHSAPGRFYMLPKIHKENNPGRPIISGTGTLTEPISSYIDSLIKDIPPTHESFLRDTNHFLREIADVKIPDGAFLVTLDVSSLYTNIPHDDGVRALVESYGTHNPVAYPSKKVIEIFTRLVLDLNSFEFNNQYYLQISGTAMGTRMAPNYANIFMHHIESNFLSSCNIKPLLYKRYLDDIFIIWTHSENELLKFIQAFNQVHPSIYFTHTYSNTEINFLDVLIRVDDGALVTNVYRKPTDRQQYLHFKSCHPRHCKTSIPYSQAHRFRRICSRTEDFHKNSTHMREVLLNQEYPPAIIDDAIKKAENLDRQILLNHQRNADQHRNKNLLLTFTSNPPNINKVLRKHFNILEQSVRLSKIFTSPPCVVYRRPKNIKDHLINSKIGVKPQIGCHPCGKSRCKVCKHMQTTTVAKSTHSDFKHRIRGALDCDSDNVIYLLECGVCNKQYVGQTDTPFRIRFNNHRAHVRSLPGLPLSKHCTLKDHSFDDIRVTLLENNFRTIREREQRESYFIYKFNTIKYGINEHPGTLSALRPLKDANASL